MDYKFEDLQDITLEGLVKRGQRQDGSPMNDIVDFAPAGTNLGETQEEE